MISLREGRILALVNNMLLRMVKEKTSANSWLSGICSFYI